MKAMLLTLASTAQVAETTENLYALHNSNWVRLEARLVGIQACVDAAKARGLGTYVCIPYARDLTNFRAGWTRPFDASYWAGRPSYSPYPMTWDTREEAQAWADGMNEIYGSQPVRPHAAAYGH